MNAAAIGLPPATCPTGLTHAMISAGLRGRTRFPHFTAGQVRYLRPEPTIKVLFGLEGVSSIP